MPEVFDINAASSNIWELERQSLNGDTASTNSLINELVGLMAKPKQLEQVAGKLAAPTDAANPYNFLEQDRCGNILTLKFDKDGKSQFIDFTIDEDGRYRPPLCIL